MIEKWTYVDGVRINIPADTVQAKEWGWHKGVDFNYFLKQDRMYDYNDVVPWCRENLNRNLFQTFGGSIWFYREEDAMFCKLKWS